MGPTLSPKKRKRKNVVTPEKTESSPEKETPVQNEGELHSINKEYESITVELFDYSAYSASYEETCLPSSFMSPDSTFKYSSPSETESEISAGFGGWQTSQQNSALNIYPDVSATNISCVNPVPASPHPTVSRFPLVPRNSYGGIRDCLPPEQLANWVKITSKPNYVATELSEQSAPYTASPRTFTAEQLLRMEQNKVKALERLRASSQQTQIKM